MHPRLIKEPDSSLFHEIELADLFSLVYNYFVWLDDATEHTDNQFVLKSYFSILEESFELILEMTKQFLHQFSLNVWRQFVVKVELFNEKIEIVHERRLNESFDVHVQLHRQLFLSRRELQFA